MSSRPHLRIEKPDAEPGRFYAVTNDKIVAVGEDGTEVDISICVAAWHEHSVVGEIRRIEIVLLGYLVMQRDGSITLSLEDET